VEIAEEPIANLARHAEVPIAFRVERVLDVSLVDGGLGGIVISEAQVAAAWVKDYDAIKGEGPTRWAKRFDLSNWGLIAGHDGSGRVGGAVVAFNTAGVNMLEGRSDVAVLWDMRVRPDVRSTGIGTMLFGAVVDWARDRNCRLLKVESQNTNVPACQFYRRMGCTLASFDRFAYPDLPNDVQLVWVKEL
jgi:GNAT superfamily N-acetyltransferase